MPIIEAELSEDVLFFGMFMLEVGEIIGFDFLNDLELMDHGVNFAPFRIVSSHF